MKRTIRQKAKTLSTSMDSLFSNFPPQPSFKPRQPISYLYCFACSNFVPPRSIHNCPVFPQESISSKDAFEDILNLPPLEPLKLKRKTAPSLNSLYSSDESLSLDPISQESSVFSVFNDELNFLNRPFHEESPGARESKTSSSGTE